MDLQANYILKKDQRHARVFLVDLRRVEWTAFFFFFSDSTATIIAGKFDLAPISNVDFRACASAYVASYYWRHGARCEAEMGAARSRRAHTECSEQHICVLVKAQEDQNCSGQLNAATGYALGEASQKGRKLPALPRNSTNVE